MPSKHGRGYLLSTYEGRLRAGGTSGPLDQKRESNVSTVVLGRVYPNASDVGARDFLRKVHATLGVSCYLFYRMFAPEGGEINQLVAGLILLGFQATNLWQKRIFLLGRKNEFLPRPACGAQETTTWWRGIYR